MYLLALYVLHLRIYLEFQNIISRHTVLGLFQFVPLSYGIHYHWKLGTLGRKIFLNVSF